MFYLSVTDDDDDDDDNNNNNNNNIWPKLTERSFSTNSRMSVPLRILLNIKAEIEIIPEE